MEYSSVNAYASASEYKRLLEVEALAHWQISTLANSVFRFRFHYCFCFQECAFLRRFFFKSEVFLGKKTETYNNKSGQYF